MIEKLNRKFQKYRLETFFSLVGTQFAVVAFITAFFPLLFTVSLGDASNQRTRVIIVLMAALIAGLFYSGLLFIRIKLGHRDNLEKIFSQKWLLLVIAFLPFLINGILSFDIISPEKIFQLFGLLLSFWVSCLEFLLFFSGYQSVKNQLQNTECKKQQPLIILGMSLFYIFLLIPSRVYSFMDGIPLEKPLEFVLATLLIPLLFIINKSFYSRRYILITTIVLLILKLVVAFSLPESGLNVQFFTNGQNLADGKAERSYTSIYHPDVSQIMRAPYENTRQFPFSLLSDKILDNINDNFPTVFLTIQGSGRLEKGEKIFFQTAGLKQGNVIITDRNSGKDYSYDFATLRDGIVNPEIPNLTEFKISGTLVFNNTFKYSLIPMIQYPDGTQADLFQSDRVWTSADYVDKSPQFLLLAEWLVFFINLIMLAEIFFGLIQSILKLEQIQHIRITDIFLFSSSMMFLLVPKILGKDFKVTTPYKMLSLEVIKLTLPIVVILLIAGIVVLLEQKTRNHSSENPELKYLFSIGIMILMIFFVLNFTTLRETNVFSHVDDPHEYQNFANNIFVHGDWFLLSTPPRAYKVLFPYIVGILHVIFGASSSAQLFLNAWCCVLSGMLLIKLLKDSGCRPVLAFSSAWIFTIILYGIFSYRYFQFGLIEPLATYFLVLTFRFAQKQQAGWLVFSAIITILLHMDYAGPVIAAVLFYFEPLTGSVGSVWKKAYQSLGLHWKQIGIYLVAILLPSLIIILFYFTMTPNYWLGGSDTKHTSINSIIDGWFRIAAGGNSAEIYFNFTWFPLLTILTTSTLILGTFTGLLAAIIRPKFIQNLDLKWSIVLVSLFAVYIFVRPTAYSPRFSTPLLPIVMMILTITVEQVLRFYDSKRLSINQENIH